MERSTYMDAGTFMFNGKSSKDFGVIAQYKPDRIVSTKKFTIENPSNRIGSVYRDMNTYDNTDIKLELWFKLQDNNTIDNIVDWLTTSDYADFIPWYDPLFTYRAIVDKNTTYQYHKADNNYMTFDLELSLLPMKYLTTSLTQKVPITNATYITNPYKYNAYPYIEINASNKGDVTLSINKKSFIYKSFTGVLTIDSELPQTNMPAKAVGLDFPILQPGKNLIEFTNADSVTMIYKWVRRAL